MKHYFNRFAYALLNTRAAAIYMFIFAFSIGAATFIENDFGTDAAQKHIYTARWFELLLILFSFSIAYNVKAYQFIQRKKWSNLTFHLAIILIIFGAGVTRYFGFEGVMPIRKGQTANVFLSSNAFVNVSIFKDGQEYEVHEPVLFSSLGKNHFEKEYSIGNTKIALNLVDFIPNPEEVVNQDKNGVPALNIVIGSANGRKEYVIKKGEKKSFEGQFFNFTSTPTPGAVQLYYENKTFYISSDVAMTQMTMATQENANLEASQTYDLQTRSLYQSENHQFVVGSTFFAGETKLISKKQKIDNSSTVALKMEVKIDQDVQTKIIEGQKGNEGLPVDFESNNTQIRISYGSKLLNLPFGLKLNYFKMSRYPGTNSPESFLSNVTLIDQEKGIQSVENIFMNHILDHRGYRFFQSSYDQDEEGTYLSVNHDFAGTWISYIGYILLALGMLMALFDKSSRFTEIKNKLKSMKAASILILGMVVSNSFSALAATEIKPTLHFVSEEHADQFSRLQVQDIRGRMKPMHTLSREVMRKLHGTESYDGYTADQVILSIYVNNSEWVNLPFIKTGDNAELNSKLGINAKFAAYADFFNEKGSYKLATEIQRINLKPEKDRSIYDKLVISVDERVNIMNMTLSGLIFKIVPVKGDKNNTWVSNHSHGEEVHSALADQFFEKYQHELNHAIYEGGYDLANSLIADLGQYQKQISGGIMLSDRQMSIEILLNRSLIFNRLSVIYILFGLVFLALMFLQIFKPNIQSKKIILSFQVLLYLFFGLHTLALLARWYVSGHAPWSNGYESMIYIAWTTTLAGIIFTRKTLGGLAATNILAGVLLLIALLSYMNPEITPLVPVLKSYWLTIHVSMEAGSYGFLMLGAIIGILNLLILAVMNQANKERSLKIMQELTYVSEMTLIGGLFMLSIGTFLGGVWANESWGRYWGWDAKETWALVSILVYAIILHVRLIPKLNGLFLFNFLTIFGLASVIMTYYGVNYYLSGLHSYATGDPLPIPNWVYISIAALIVLTVISHYKKRKYSIS
ncbi:MAG: cytochrome c biogenesis protein CcsA [Crocinitomicaceae bacterium]